MLGYKINFGDDVFCMWNPTRNSINNSRYFMWLNRMYYLRTGNAPFIGGPTFCDIKAWGVIGVINTTTANDTQDDEYAFDDQ